jgi:uncharacterized protein YfdQ (DUF2303 family)
MADTPISEKAVAELVSIGKVLGKPFEIPNGEFPFTILPNGCSVHSLEKFVFNEHNAAPERKTGSISVFDVPSFCEYYTLFSDENSRVFANETTSSFLAILDYHGALDGGPRWCKHRLSMALRSSEEWNVWSGKDGEKFNQMDFSDFIEDNAPDIVMPNAATMLEVAKDLRAKTDVDFGSAIRTSNGSVQFKYSEQVKGTYGAGNIDIPEQFTISIPVHIGSERVSLTARLRYRLNAGKLLFYYNLLRASAVKRDAFYLAHRAISESLNITLINGTPA